MRKEERRREMAEDSPFLACVYLDYSQNAEESVASAAAQPNRDLRQAYAESATAAHPMRARVGSCSIQ